MAAVTETYVPCYNMTMTIDSVSHSVIEFSSTHDHDVVDFTNNLGLGWRENLATVHGYTFNMTIGYKGATPPTYVCGAKYAFVQDGNATWVADGGGYMSGDLRIESIEVGMSPKDGLMHKIKATSQGPVVTTRPGP